LSVGPQEINCSIYGRYLTHVHPCVLKCCNSRRDLITKNVRHRKLKATESPITLTLKQHKTPHCADTQCCVLKQKENRAMGDGREILPSLKAPTVNTGPVATSRRAMIP
jgi:hypothetical protein